MSPDSFLDHLPSQEREKIRKRMRSPEAYERLRDSVKGPEDLEREMKRNAESADISFALEADRHFQEQAKEKVQSAVQEQGIEAFLNAPADILNAISKGNFEVRMDHTKKEPTLVVAMKNVQNKSGGEAPMGNIQEVFPLKTSLQQSIISSLQRQSDHDSSPKKTHPRL